VIRTSKQQAAFDRAKAREKARQVAEIANERERIAKIKADPAKALALFKRRQAERMRNLKDPNWGEKRLFPEYTGQTTLAYVRSFQALQRKAFTGDKDLPFVLAGGAK